MVKWFCCCGPEVKGVVEQSCLLMAAGKQRTKERARKEGPGDPTQSPRSHPHDPHPIKPSKYDLIQELPLLN